MTDEIAKAKGIKVGDIIDYIDYNREFPFPIIISPESEKETWVHMFTFNPLLTAFEELVVSGLGVDEETGHLQIWVVQEYAEWSGC